MTMEIPTRHFLNLYVSDANCLAFAESLDYTFRKIFLDQNYLSMPNGSHQFNPQGVTGLYLLKTKDEELEGHVSIHTWPEYQQAAIDLLSFKSLKELSPLIAKIKTEIPGRYEHISPGTIITEDMGKEVIGTLENICKNDSFENEQKLLSWIKRIAQESNFNVVGEISTETNQYISAAVVLSESHFSVHYNKRTNNLNVDIFTCGQEGDPNKGFTLLCSNLKPKTVLRQFLYR